MSFDIFFLAAEDGVPTGIPAAEVFEAFGPSCEWEKKERPDSKNLYAWNAQSEWGWISMSSFGDDESLIDGFSINRPGSDPELWKILFFLMKKHPLGMCFPCEDVRWVLGDESHVEHFDGMGLDEIPPLVVSGPEELLASIQGGQAAADAYRDHVLKSTGSEPLP